MARPVQRRTERTYRREIEQLTRLRTAIIIDETIAPKDSQETTEAIDELIKKLNRLMKSA